MTTICCWPGCADPADPRWFVNGRPACDGHGGLTLPDSDEGIAESRASHAAATVRARRESEERLRADVAARDARIAALEPIVRAIAEASPDDDRISTIKVTTHDGRTDYIADAARAALTAGA